MPVDVAAHEVFEGEPVGILHAIEFGEDETVCEDFRRDELTVVPGMSWADTAGRRCPVCEVTASARGLN